ncbi:MAG: CBS domain-containing protein [Saprospiraceae bacterium]|nr:CBS domain-containing protein [Saprospiraceae bacterium]MBL0293190.1 CBS domain-containing protein [Saprospiraceae bacterium]
MGEAKAVLLKDDVERQQFVKALLDDIQAFDYMLKNEWFENDITRIGAEQELVIVDKKTFKPALINLDVLERLNNHPQVVTELAKFNLETNLSPLVFEGNCFSELENENLRLLKMIEDVLVDFDARLILTGICPTLRKFDLDLKNLTDKPRYRALMAAIDAEMKGSSYELRLSGIDEIHLKHDSPLLEACNTSFQVHLQVSQFDFVKMYNIAQSLAAPTMAIAANSPIVFGRRLWHESRIALFQQSIDTRTSHDHLRETSPRVDFGNQWLQESILEIYREDIARFRVLLGGKVEEDSIKKIVKGEIPKLKSLLMHNSTVYRWNRPCYGISPNGKPHLRIENRVMPSGPTVLDEIANSAFWLGAMIGLGDQIKDIRDHMSFEDARDNFGKAAMTGMDSKFTWFKDKKINASDLILHELLPLAKEGLKKQKVNSGEIDKYLGVIEERTKSHMNGARWMLRAYTDLKKKVSNDEALTILTSSIIKNQDKHMPVHTWEMPNVKDLENYSPSNLKVQEFMQTDLFTVQKDDIIELVAEIMDWRMIRYMPVEDKKGHLIGLISARLLLRHFTKAHLNKKKRTTVEEIMIKTPITIDPDATIQEALNLMRTKRLGCLPVVKGGELIGIISEMDFLRITARLIDALA